MPFTNRFPRLALWCSSVLVVFGFFFSVAGTGAPPPRSNGDWCEVCRSNIYFRVFSLTDKFRDIKRYMCEPCSKITTRCEVCELPVLKYHGLHLPDNRVYCPEDEKLPVMDETLAKELFAQAKSDVQDILRQYQPLPEWNIGVHLVTRENFNEQYRRTPSDDDPSRLLGLTITRLNTENNEKLVFDIYLLHGVPRDQFLCVCAHEYAHTWLQEHSTNVRQLHKDSIEGFCELIAYKMADIRNLKREKARIMAGTYSRGQFQALEAAEKQYRFYDLIRWVTNGVDSWIDTSDYSRLLLLRSGSSEDSLEAAPLALPSPSPPPPQPVLDTLVLQSLSLIGRQRWARINYVGLQEGETRKVQVGETNVNVKCLKISEDFVEVQVLPDERRIILKKESGKSGAQRRGGADT